MVHVSKDSEQPITAAHLLLIEEANSAFGADPDYAVALAEGRHALHRRKDARAARLADGFEAVMQEKSSPIMN